MARLGVSLDHVEADTGGGPLPVGRYQFQAIEEELKGNSKGTGEVLSLTFEVLGSESGEHIGRRLWVTFNVTHENPKAQEIGQRQLKALCKAIGVEGVDDTEDLLWKPFFADTKIEVDDRQRERGGIKKYLFGDDLNPPAGKASPTPPPRPAPRTAPQAARPAPSRPAAGGGNPLPWPRRNPAPDLDDSIPF